MNVDRWFSSLDREQRKKVLAALHYFRGLADGNVLPLRSGDGAKAFWPHVQPLLQALDDDHFELKQRSIGPGSYQLKYCNLCDSAGQTCRDPLGVSASG